jgi:hypothetical protein
MTLDRVGSAAGVARGVRQTLDRVPGKRFTPPAAFATLTTSSASRPWRARRAVATAIHDGTLDRTAPPAVPGPAEHRRAPDRRLFRREGCFTELRFSTTSFGVRGPATARWIDSLTALRL